MNKILGDVFQHDNEQLVQVSCHSSDAFLVDELEKKADIFFGTYCSEDIHNQKTELRRNTNLNHFIVKQASVDQIESFSKIDEAREDFLTFRESLKHTLLQNQSSSRRRAIFTKSKLVFG